MSQKNEGVYQPGTYVKGDVVRVARNAAQAVALAFEGFRPKLEQVAAAGADASEDVDTPADEAPQAPVAPTPSEIKPRVRPQTQPTPTEENA